MTPLMGRCMYVLTIITHNPKYLDQFLMVLLKTLTTGLVFVRQSKQTQQPYVLIETTHYPKYLDQFLTVLLKTFTTGLVL